jgi:hypothetical protein
MTTANNQADPREALVEQCAQDIYDEICWGNWPRNRVEDYRDAAKKVINRAYEQGLCDAAAVTGSKMGTGRDGVVWFARRIHDEILALIPAKPGDAS